MTHQIQVLTVEGSKMEVFVFEPEGKGPFPRTCAMHAHSCWTYRNRKR